MQTPIYDNEPSEFFSRIEKQLLNEVFAKYCKHNFAVGVYESERPMMSTATTSTASSIPYTYNTVIKTKMVECTANVAGLDHNSFDLAVEEFIKLSREKTYNILKGE
jgi:hypothetical protein